MINDAREIKKSQMWQLDKYLKNRGGTKDRNKVDGKSVEMNEPNDKLNEI